ncbi:CehA/McbA family metallohydrolase [Paenibacillus sp. GCM10027628]|uniref:CehA/McbA family metallohydrolase n=1 Tax=Paenibacillus sp. GCM10027628 TaxID=3273413 RepID=UPI00362A2518
MDQKERAGSTITLTRRIEHSEESAYLDIPFQMPENMEEIHVAYSVQPHGPGKAVIDLGIRDEWRVRGWSGGARSEFWLGLEQATPGYLPGELAPGSWAVLHNAYKVPEEGCTVTVTIRLYLRSPRWLKGDLHTHSVHSDGKFTLEEHAAIMEQLGCDFIAMTDHNTVSQNAAYPRNTRIVMIPGMEFTTNFGHSNFLGIPDPLDDFRVTGQGDVNRKMGQARARGAAIVLNHPHCDYCPWLWDFNADFDGVEIWNGPWTARNEKALNWWHEQLLAGRRMVAVGGSDVHRPDPYVKHAMPCTWVFAEARTAADILEAIGKGRVFITYAPNGPFMELTCGSSMTGDTADMSENRSPVRLRASRLSAGDRVKLISNQGIEQEITLAEHDTADLQASPNGELWTELEAETAGRTFYRAEVWRHFSEVGQTLLAAVTNPIYFK